MLRIEMHDSPNTLTLKLEGRFTGDDAENTRTLMTRCRDGMRPLVDLTDVTFTDSVGKEVLAFFGRFGAEFVAQTSYHSTCVSACIFALSGVAQRMRTRQALLAQTPDAGPTHVSRKPRESETPRKHIVERITM